MKRQRAWRAPNNPTGPAKQVWKFLFPHDPWPRGMTVRWAGWMNNAQGLASGDMHRTEARYRRLRRLHPNSPRIYNQVSKPYIVLSYGDAKKMPGVANGGRYRGVVATLAHEFLHIRGYHRHNPEFYAAENRLLARLGIPPRTWANNGTAIDHVTGSYATRKKSKPVHREGDGLDELRRLLSLSFS